MKRLLTSTVAVALLFVTAACTGSNPAEQPSAPAPVHTHPSAETPAQPLRAGERFVRLTMAESYTPAPPNGGNDDYRCVIVDPGVTEPVFLTGVQFQPQNATIAHHAITFAVPPEDAVRVRTLDAQWPGEGWTCFGMDGGVRTASWVDTWTPGGQETLIDGDMGYPLDPAACSCCRSTTTCSATATSR